MGRQGGRAVLAAALPKAGCARHVCSGVGWPQAGKRLVVVTTGYDIFFFFFVLVFSSIF